MRTPTKTLLFPTTLLITSSLLACCSERKTETPTKTIASSLDGSIGDKNDATWYAELNFEKGSTRISDEGYSSLDGLVQKSMRSGSVKEIKVMSWADRAYPTKSQPALSSQQKKLADHRNQKVKEYLKRAYPSLNVSVYNMAKRPNLIEDLFETSDSRTKKTIESAGISFNADHSVKEAKKESSSLVLSILE